MNDAVSGVGAGGERQEQETFAVLCSEAVKCCHLEVNETAPVALLQFCLVKLCIPSADCTAVDII